MRRLAALAVFGAALALAGVLATLVRGLELAATVAMAGGGVLALWALAALAAQRCRRLKP